MGKQNRNIKKPSMDDLDAVLSDAHGGDYQTNSITRDDVVASEKTPFRITIDNGNANHRVSSK